MSSLEEKQKKLLKSWKEDGKSLPESINYLVHESHIWCGHFDIALEAFNIHKIMFEDPNYKLPPFTNTFLESSNRQISLCVECSLSYRKIKEDSKKIWSSTIRSDLIEKILKEIQIKEKTRIKEYLDVHRYDTTIIINLIHEVINNIDLLDDYLLKNRFLNVFEKFIEEYDISFGDPEKVVPGLYLMLMAKSEGIRNWSKDFLFQRNRLITGDQYQHVSYLVNIVLKDLEFNQNNPGKINDNTCLSEDIEDTWDCFPDFLTQFSNDTFLNNFPKDKLINILFREFSKKSNSLRKSVVEISIILFQFLKTQTIKEFQRVNNDFNNGLTIIKFCDLLIENFQINRDDVLQVKIIELFYVVLFECIPKNQIGELSNHIVGILLNKIFYNSNYQLKIQVKSNLFLLIIDILLNSFSINFITDKFCKLLIKYSINQIFEEKIQTTNQGIKKSIILVEHILLYGSIELRKSMQYILNSTNSSFSDRELFDTCDYWISSIWQTLLTMEPVKIPFRIHLVIFKIHRILGLLSLSNVSQASHLDSKIYRSLKEYQELMVTYITKLSESYKFQVMHSGRMEDVLDNREFHKSVFSFLVSPNQDLVVEFKQLLIKKFPKAQTNTQTATASFKEMFSMYPEDSVKGALGIFRDFFFQIGYMNCIDSINMIYYYGDHLIYQIKSNSQMLDPKFLSVIIDTLWPSFEYALTLKDKILSTKVSHKVVYMFDLIKDCIGTIATVNYSSIGEYSTPKPSFLYSCGNNQVLLFESIEQYPQYIRKPMLFTKCITNDQSKDIHSTLDHISLGSSKINYQVIIYGNNSSSNSRGSNILDCYSNVIEINQSNFIHQILNGFEFISENKDYAFKHIDSSSQSNFIVIDEDEDDSTSVSVISSISRWIKSFIDWNLTPSKEWIGSVISVLKYCKKRDIKMDKYFEPFIKKIQQDQIELTDDQNKIIKFLNLQSNNNDNISTAPSTISSAASSITVSKPTVPTTTTTTTTSISSKPQPVTTQTLKPSSLKPQNSPTPLYPTNNSTTLTSFNNKFNDKFDKYDKFNDSKFDKFDKYNDNKFNNYSSNQFNNSGFKGSAFSYMKKDFSDRESTGFGDDFERNSVPVAGKDKKKTMLLDIGVPGFKKLPGKQINQNDDGEDDPIPRIESLYLIILKWEPRTFDKDTDTELKCRPVPPKFTDKNHYIGIFEPLLIEEFRAQVQRNIEEGDQPIEVAVENQLQENEFLDVDMEVAFKDNLDILVDDFILIVQQKPKTTVNGATTSATTATPKLSTLSLYKDENVISAFGKIERKDRKGGNNGQRRGSSDNRAFILKVRFHKPKNHIFTQAIYKPSNKWAIQKITSLSTVSREYMALQHVGRIPLGKMVIQPHLFNVLNKSNGGKRFYEIPPKLENILIKNLNPSQMNSVVETCKLEKGFTLLQGPPGTGKTKTIMSLLSVFSSVLNNMNDSKILVCAPSNAAVDEIALRIIKEGLLDSNGIKFKPYICRIGHLNHIHPDVHQIAVDKLLDQEVESENSEISSELEKVESSNTKVKQLKIEISKVDSDIRRLEEMVKTLKPAEQQSIKSEISSLYSNKTKYKQELKSAIEDERVITEKYTTSKKNLFIGIISKCNIILSTLAGSGHDYLFSAVKHFDLVIIDEAAQAVELSTLIPLRHDVKKCILVGDPQQLPPTTLSQCAAKFQYEVSLFQRLANSGLNPTVLKIQYRMHPLISLFPSQKFYNGALENGENVLKYQQKYYSDPVFGPLSLIDICDSVETKGTFMSLKNELEADLAKLIVDQLYSKFPYTQDMDIGVITPYKAQMKELSKIFSRYKSVEVNTIDGFQGKEKDIIIFSTVRAHSGKSIGFLSDIRRMNVGLTRGKYSMIILGNTSLLSNNPDWGKLIASIKNTKNCFFSISKKFILNKKLDVINFNAGPIEDMPKILSNSANSLNNISTTPTAITIQELNGDENKDESGYNIPPQPLAPVPLKRKEPTSIFIKKTKKPAAKPPPSINGSSVSQITPNSTIDSATSSSPIIPTTPSITLNRNSPIISNSTINLNGNKTDTSNTQYQNIIIPSNPSLPNNFHNIPQNQQQYYQQNQQQYYQQNQQQNIYNISNQQQYNRDSKDRERSHDIQRDKERNDSDRDRYERDRDRYGRDRDRFGRDRDRYERDRDRERNNRDRDRYDDDRERRDRRERDRYDDDREKKKHKY